MTNDSFRPFHKIRLLLFFLGSFYFLLSCKETKQKAIGIIESQIEHQGLQRAYTFYAPEHLEKDAPLVMVIHGFTSSAARIMEYSKMNDIADENGFAVLYPQGTKDEKGNTFWNVGYEFHADSKVDDLDFIITLTQFIQEEYALSKTNTFVTGMSNGGEMCYLLSCRHSNVFKACAPVAGTMMSSFFDDCSPEYLIPTFAIFGTHDDVTNYEGDDQNKDGWGAYKSIPFIIDFWTSKMKANLVQKDTLKDLITTDSSFVITKNYESPKTKFVYYEVIGGGHDWPGAWGNEDINASQEIWNFFKDYIQ